MWHRPSLSPSCCRARCTQCDRVPAHSRSPFLCLVDSAMAALHQTLEQKLDSPHCKREIPHLPWLCGSRAESVSACPALCRQEGVAPAGPQRPGDGLGAAAGELLLGASGEERPDRCGCGVAGERDPCDELSQDKVARLIRQKRPDCSVLLRLPPAERGAP